MQYVEIRSLDINPFSPFGISLEQLRWIEVLFVYCLLSDESLIDRKEREEIDINEHEVSHQGRKPGLFLRKKGESVSLSQWAQEIFTDLEKIAECMDSVNARDEYTKAIQHFAPCVDSVDETFSAKMLNEMRNKQLSYYEYIESLGKEYCQFYSNRKNLDDVDNRIVQEVARSISKQQTIEQSDTVDFTTFLKDYFTTSYKEGG